MQRESLKYDFPLLGPILESALFEAERRIGFLGEMDLKALRKELQNTSISDVGYLFKGELLERVVHDIEEYGAVG